MQDVKQLSEKVSYIEWEKDFVKMLKKHAPLEMKVIWRNHKDIMIIMTWSALKERANISNNSGIISNFKIQELYQKYKQFFKAILTQFKPLFPVPFTAKKSAGVKVELISKFMTSQPVKQTIAINILPNISRGKGNQTMKFG